VGDADATKVHVHTDDPGRALSLATAMGVIGGVDVADMRSQIAERDARLLEGGPPHPSVDRCCGSSVRSTTPATSSASSRGTATPPWRPASARGASCRGGQTMNPSTAEILAAVEACAADGVVVLPNNRNVVLAAHAAARGASVPTSVVETTSIPEGLAALVPYDPAASLETNVAAMSAAAGAVVTGEVTRAVRDATVDGLTVREGAFIGLVGGRAVATTPPSRPSWPRWPTGCSATDGPSSPSSRASTSTRRSRRPSRR
jgi:dihydroxyacetone kinase-like predicted kinase